MKTIILHLSDLHLVDEELDNKVTKIKDSLSIFDEIKKIIIIISGDVSQNGLHYDLAERFLEALKNTFSKIYKNIGDIDVFVVPGNHDIDYDNKQVIRKEVVKLLNENLLRSFYSSDLNNDLGIELEKSKEFFKFAKKYDCFQENQLIDVKEIDLNGKLFRFNLINSSPLSTYEDDDSDIGLHYLQAIHINKLSQISSNPTITIIHHPTEWFHEKPRELLEKEILDNTNFLLLGHEHKGNLSNREDGDNNTEIIYGGSLKRHGGSTKSDYHMLVIEEDLDYEIYHFLWNEKLNFYQHSKIAQNSLQKKEMTCITALNYSEEFINDFYVDPYLFDFVPSIKTLFTFPDIDVFKQDRTKVEKIIDFESLIDVVNINELIAIHGKSSSGKTTLSKMLFKKLGTGYIPIYFDAEESKNAKKLNNVVKMLLNNHFGFKSGIIEFFEQLPKTNKVIIIDNYDSVKNKDIWIPFLFTIFGKIIIVSTSNSNINIRNIIDEKTANTKKSVIFQIKPFLKKKREALINETCKYIISEKKYKLNPKKVAHFIESQLHLFSLSPLFIIMYVRQYGMPSLTGKSATKVFSIIFENNIISKLHLASKVENEVDVDLTLYLIEIISYESYTKRIYPITTELIHEVIADHKKEYGNDVDPNDFVKLLKDSKIVKPSGSSSSYVFNSKRYLSYFIAKELKRRFDEGEREFLKDIYDNLLMKINSEILLFFAFLFNRNNVILEGIIDKAIEYMSEWEEINLNKFNISYFDNLNLVMNVKEPNKDIYQDVVDKQEEKEEKVYKQEFEIITTDVYDLEIEESNHNPIIKEMVYGIKYVNLISSIFPDFFKFLKVPLKKKFLETVFSLPNKLLFKVLNEFDKDYEKNMRELLAELKIRNPGSSNEENRTKAKQLLHQVSESIIIHIYRISLQGIVNTESNSWVKDTLDVNKNTHQLMDVFIDAQLLTPNQFGTKAIQLMNNKNNIVSNVSRTISSEYFLKLGDQKKIGKTRQLYDETFNIKTKPPRKLLK
jgi:hypothetical protein